MADRNHPYPGLWISFEAGEGAGKGTQKRMLAKYFEDKGLLVKLGREPGTTPAGEAIRNLLQNSSFPELNPRTEMLLYIGAGVEFFEGQVKPILEKGEFLLQIDGEILLKPIKDMVLELI